MRKTIIAVRLEPDTLKKLDKTAKKQKQSRSEMIRAALEAWLSNPTTHVN